MVFSYIKAPTWGFGTGERPPIYQNEKYEYFNHAYNDVGLLNYFRNSTFQKLIRDGKNT